MHPLVGAVRALQAALDDFDDAAARELGVGRSDLRALNLLEHGPLPAGALAMRLGLSSGATTALVDRLVAAGWAHRRAATQDARKVLVALEPEVWRAFARVYGPCGAAVTAVGEATPETAGQAVRLLDEVVETVRAQATRLRA